MRSFSSGGLALINSNTPYFVADLFTFILLSGTTYYWSSWDNPLSHGGTTWAATGPFLTRTRLGVKNTVEVPELQLRMLTSGNMFINSVLITEQVHNGLFDGATVTMSRVFMPTPGDTSYGLLLLFQGRQSTAVIDSNGVTLTAKGNNVLMNQYAPRNLYQTTCLHTFCDVGCALSASNYIFHKSCLTGSTRSSLVWTLPGGFTDSQFKLGKVRMTSGPASGQIRTVKSAGGVSTKFLNLTYPLYDTPVAGNTFDILMGCERQQSNCSTRKQADGTAVDNTQHFRGYPYVPVAELAV